LGVETLGIKETFFDLGGTSLLSVRLFAEIERRLGVRLAPATLFQAPNVEALAELLDGQVTSGGTPGLVELATGSEHGTLFLLHDQRGEVELYRALAERLSPRLRVLGVEPERAERIPALQTRVEPMVSYYVARIRSVQPAGPYLLGGLDAGGVLAFEVACRLRAEGEAVPLLALFDAPERRSPLSSLGLWRDRLDRSLGTLSPSDSPLETVRSFAKKAFDASAWFAFDTLRVRLLRRSTDRGEKPPWYVEFIPPEIVSLYAESEPRAARFDGNVVLLRALGAGSASPRDRPVRQRDRDETLGWQARTGGRVHVERVAGGHLTMFEEPHVSALAEQLSRALGACRG
ncbi:MAG TPA: thioesterase domain-containing protein, partial [Polyangiaceae bacterium]